MLTHLSTIDVLHCLLTKKEINVIVASIEDSKQNLDKIFVPQKSKETEVIDTDIDSSVDRIVDILRSEIKAF